MIKTITDNKLIVIAVVLSVVAISISLYTYSRLVQIAPSVDGNCYYRTSGGCLTEDATQWGEWCIDPWVTGPPCTG